MRTTPARKPRTECCCHSVAVMMAAIVAPAGVRSIAMMRACLVSGSRCWSWMMQVPVACEMRAWRSFGRLSGSQPSASIWAWSWDPLRFMRRHPPHHLSPARANHPAGQDPEARLSRPKSPQQRSDQARKPVNSEQDSCSKLHSVACLVNWVWPHGPYSAIG